MSYWSHLKVAFQKPWSERPGPINHEGPARRRNATIESKQNCSGRI